MLTLSKQKNGLAAGVTTGSLLLYHTGLLKGRTLFSTAFRKSDGMILAAYGPSDILVMLLADAHVVDAVHP